MICPIKMMFALSVAAFVAVIDSQAQGVLTQHNDNGRTGAYLQESVLSPANVSPGTLGRLYSLTVTGQIPAQPLYVPGVQIASGASPKDVLYVATRTNQVYAFDVGTPSLSSAQRQLWSKQLTDPRGFGAQELPGMKQFFPGDPRAKNGPCLQSLGPVGINSTPVIDPASNAMWVIYRTDSPFANHVYDAKFYLRKIDIRTGATIAEQPIAPSDNAFEPNKVLTRTGLLLDHGVIYIGFAGAVCDAGGGDWKLSTQPHGWVMAFDSNTLNLLATLNTTPNSNLGGIWQSGYELAADQSGFVYAQAGNNQGLVNGQLQGELSEAILKLKLNLQTRSFQVQHFTAPNWKRLDAGDTDLASGGPFFLPNGFVAGAGKQGWLSVFDPANMSQPKQSFQAFYNSWHAGISPYDYEASQTNGPNVHGTPVICRPENSNYSLVYAMPEKEYLKAFRVDGSGHFDERPIASTQDSGIRSARGMPGGFVSLSANGGRNGIVWVSAAEQNSEDAINTDGSFLGRLMAFDAISLRKLWQSADQPAVSLAKFIPPTIAAGKVFQVAYQDEVVVYGLTSQGNAPSPPVLPTVRQVSAVWRNPNHLDLFMTSRDPLDGSVLSTNWEAQCVAPATNVARGWRGWFPIESSMDLPSDDEPLPAGFQFSAAAAQAVTAVWRNPNHLDLFATDADGRVMSIAWQPVQNSSSGWQAWFPVSSAAGMAAAGQPVTAVWRNANHFDLFITGKDGSIMSTYFDNNAWQPGWFTVASTAAIAAPTQRSAVWSNANHLDLSIAAPDGRVLSTYFENNQWLGSWFPI